jgi:hypothetical protein
MKRSRSTRSSPAAGTAAAAAPQRPAVRRSLNPSLPPATAIPGVSGPNWSMVTAMVTTEVCDLTGEDPEEKHDFLTTPAPSKGAPCATPLLLRAHCVCLNSVVHVLERRRPCAGEGRQPATNMPCTLLTVAN